MGIGNRIKTTLAAATAAASGCAPEITAPVPSARIISVTPTTKALPIAQLPVVADIEHPAPDFVNRTANPVASTKTR